MLDTPALAFYDPGYEDTQAPGYKPSALQESTRLDESLWRNPANGWALYNQFADMQQDSSQEDPLTWLTMMASLSPNTAPQPRGASVMYQLFAPQDGDYMYHGLNFAAYDGKVNRFDDGGRTIAIGELPEAYVRAHGNMPVVTPAGNRTTLSGAYKNYNQTPVNTDDVPGLTDYLVTQEQPDIADAREIELAQQHRANERFNNQVDNTPVRDKITPK